MKASRARALFLYELIILPLAGYSGGCGDARGLWLELSSTIIPLERLTFTVIGTKAALVRQVPIPEDGSAPVLPGRVLLDGGDRRERVRLLAYGWRGATLVAFGGRELELLPGLDATVPLELGAPLADADGDLVPDRWDGCPKVADPAQQDQNADGKTDACDAPVGPGACPGNLAANGDFETDVSGWWSNGGEITRVEGGLTGKFAGRTCKLPSGSPKLFTISDSPDTVKSPRQGETYRVEAWVRSPAGPQEVVPVMRERSPSGNHVGQSKAQGLLAGPTWGKVSTTYTILEAGSAGLEVYFSARDAPDGRCFDLDAVCVVRGP
ncbi:MAG: carbohydrate binding domain-containing protein [Deltaproteobacteria bacterium]|nr:carbohydrate binding domain-containing protein [Deltaproteobacteria bacterium]